MANKLQKENTTVQKVVKKQKAQPPVSAAKTSRPAGAVHFSMPSSEYVTAVGRRKTATARVRLYKEAGDFVVNDQLVSEYFRSVVGAPSLYNLPMITVDVLGKYAISVKVDGSGLRSQVDAVNHAVSRALLKIDPEFRVALKKKGLLMRDDRMKETRKIGKGGKARRTKQSPKR
ncbi:30S ribosomal protein S9 [soil metagenome]